MTFVPYNNFDSSLFKQSTLLVPTVSIGNVPQLTADVLVHTFQFERVGFLNNDTVLPVSGIREDTNTPGISVPIEVFQSKDNKWTCIQQRSPTIKGKRQEYLENLKEFATSFQSVIIFTSMDASRRLDSQIQSVPFRIYGHLANDNSIIPILENDKLELPGSGLAKHIYEKLSTDINTTMFIMFALEGDNLQDSIEYMKCLNHLLNIQNVNQVSIPNSWKFLFGTPFNAELYQ